MTSILPFKMAEVLFPDSPGGKIAHIAYLSPAFMATR
jgi:hypothetical protein